MPTDLAKKWTGGDCGLRQSTGNAERTIDLARLRECDLRKGDLTFLGYRASRGRGFRRTSFIGGADRIVRPLKPELGKRQWIATLKVPRHLIGECKRPRVI